MAPQNKKPNLIPLHLLQPSQSGDFFALLTEKELRKTRENKPFYVCKFKDLKRTVESTIWADSQHFLECEEDWKPGSFFKIRGIFTMHAQYGARIEIVQIRPVREEDQADGFRESDFVERSRFDSAQMFDELLQLVESEVRDSPLKKLITDLLTTHRECLLQLPAHPRAFYPYAGGWLEHTLSVTRSALLLADRYLNYYPELTPPLNRDLIAAGAILHDIGRAREIVPGSLGQPSETTIDGFLFGHSMLGRDLVRDAARNVPDLNAELVTLLEHMIVAHLAKPEWGSPRQPAFPEVLILHHADDLDAKLEMYVRCLTHDVSEGALTDRDPVIGKQLLKKRSL